MKNTSLSHYINRHIIRDDFLTDIPHPDLGIIIVIPCHDEEDIHTTLTSIFRCNPPSSAFEIIVSINAGSHHPDHIHKKNIQRSKDIENFALQTGLPVFSIINNHLPPKKAGVGLGRKIGMDEAVKRFYKANNPKGVIACLDADSTVHPDYLTELEKYFSNPSFKSCSIHYEHPIKGEEYPQEVYRAIVLYELHLRYFIRKQVEIGLPFAYHTIGSSMACTVDAYCAVGGMNSRKAGEDFYFLHKMIKYGHHGNLTTTTVVPSPRISGRVPFGTGKAIGDMIRSGKDFLTYHPETFTDYAVLVDALPDIYVKKKFSHSRLSGTVLSFLESMNAQEKLEIILSNTNSYDHFVKRFYHVFDAFVFMKYLHHARDNRYPDIPVIDACKTSWFDIDAPAEKMLKTLRHMDKNHSL